MNPRHDFDVFFVFRFWGLGIFTLKTTHTHTQNVSTTHFIVTFLLLYYITINLELALPSKTLERLRATFNLQEAHKGFFPYSYISEDKMTYVGPYPSAAMTPAVLHNLSTVLNSGEFITNDVFCVCAIQPTVKLEWECHFKRKLANDPMLQDMIKYLEWTAPLNPREALFGGRTGAATLYAKTAEDEEISYVDFTSLYPTINKYGTYPVGLPAIRR